MQPASDQRVLGDFEGAIFTYDGVTSKLFRRDGGFFVQTDGPDGKLHDYRIEYTFGVAPLQQYLIRMPGGRLQALGIAWDSRPRQAGGQRWFHLYPDQKISAGNRLHWSGPDQNWNFMCADCHSTNLRKNYDFRTRTYSTTYSEIDVACEACHGPGSRHVWWARQRSPRDSYTARDSYKRDSYKDDGLLIALDEHRNAIWRVDPATGNARRSAPRMSSREIQMCARCHSRRGQIHEDVVRGQPLDDDYRVALLDADLYYPDGQIRAEDYEYGSFIQSRMFHAGVTCSDCHEPHGLKLRAPGDKLCFQCHARGKYDSPTHHFHQTGSAGARCVECHMPASLYMVVDARRDHSIRIPRPDLTVSFGVPNACGKCHSDKTAQWAAQTVRRWYGHTPTGFQQFAGALKAGSLGAPNAGNLIAHLLLRKDQPAIARASALARIGDLDSESVGAIRAGLADSDPLIRRAAVGALAQVDTNASASLLRPLLDDPVRTVRIETGAVLAGHQFTAAEDQAALRRATGEFIDAQKMNADRPEAHLNLANLFTRQKKFSQSEAELRDALSLDPSFTPATVNLADLYRGLGRDNDGERLLRKAIAHADDAALENAYGLLLVRRNRRKEALTHLAAASRLDPSNGGFAYIYAIALDDSGQTGAAIGVLRAAVERNPFDRAAIGALVSLYGKSRNPAEQLRYVEKLAALDPSNPQLPQLMRDLRAATGAVGQ